MVTQIKSHNLLPVPGPGPVFKSLTEDFAGSQEEAPYNTMSSSYHNDSLDLPQRDPIALI